ncbi:MAG: exodeoxyribonuclease VII small subunit [Anaerolineae bacterium]
MSKKIESLTFEQAFAALTETLQKLEAGDLPLADSIALYEHGMALAQHCNTQLEAAELKIKQLTPSGELETVPPD